MKTKEEHIKTTIKPSFYINTIDFEDTFSTINHKDSLESITRLVFATMPKWIEGLMKLRNVMVKLIGLSSEKPKDYNESFAVGGYIGFFKIMNLSETEIVMGADDDHLNFRAVISLQPSLTYNVFVTTLVEYNNKKGKVYMNIIKPFHRLVVRRMVKQAYKN